MQAQPRQAWILLLAFAGCSSRPDSATSTGATEAVQAFYEAILRQDWQQAYDLVHPDNQAAFSAEQFARLAESYRTDLGFEPEAVHVRSCEEHAAEATAHVVFAGTSASGPRLFKDAIVLRQSPRGWAVVLPPQFGRPRPAKRP
jgi:hypothetical protein